MFDSAISFEYAIEVFVRGFCFSRSLTCPYVAERIDGVWVMRDSPPRRRHPRVEEYVAHRIPLKELHALAQKSARGLYRICVMRTNEEDDRTIRAEFRSLGYRLMTTEAFMVHSFQSIPNVESPVPIVRVETAEQAALLHRASRRRQLLPHHLTENPPSIRQYLAVESDTAIGWAASIVAGESAWCSNVYVAPEYRRRGIARALLARLLSDDRKSGSQASVLLASHTGAKLYPVVGYDQIGELLMFVPPRR